MQKLVEVYDFVASKLGNLGDIYIAGGAVRDTLVNKKPKDYDLYILGNPQEILMVPNELADHCKHNLKWDVFNPKPEDAKNYAAHPLVNVRMDKETEIQIMYRNYSTAGQLIDEFDWDICQFAFNPVIGVVNRRSPATIKKGEELKLNKITFATGNLRRGYRFSERFEMTMRTEDIIKLCQSILLTESPSKDYII
jgi:hypothetical protein